MANQEVVASAGFFELADGTVLYQNGSGAADEEKFTPVSAQLTSISLAFSRTGWTPSAYPTLTEIQDYFTANPAEYRYELADASKHQTLYAPQNLIAYKSGQMSRIPMHRNALISVSDDVTLDHACSRIKEVYEYNGGEESLVDSADYSLDATGLIVTITGASSGEVYFVVAPYDTSGSTYGTQVAQFSTSNTTSKVTKNIKTETDITTTTYTMLDTDNVLLVSKTATAEVTDIAISSAIIAQDGRVIIVKDTGNNANTNNITLTTEGGETIEGSATLVMTVDREVVWLISDGSDLHKIN